MSWIYLDNFFVKIFSFGNLIFLIIKFIIDWLNSDFQRNIEDFV